jgi:hypothetical protein
MAKKDSHALEQTDFHHHKTDTDQRKVQRSPSRYRKADVFERWTQRYNDGCYHEYQRDKKQNEQCDRGHQISLPYAQRSSCEQSFRVRKRLKRPGKRQLIEKNGRSSVGGVRSNSRLDV